MAKNKQDTKLLKKPLTPQQKKKLYIAGGVIGFVGLVTMAMMPSKGTIYFGICKVFIEQNEPYPTSIRYLLAEEYINWNPIKIFYRRVDTFGANTVEMVDCYFKTDEAGNFIPQLDKVDYNGKVRVYEAEKQEVIDRFNKGIPAILENQPDLTYPWFSLDDIKSYKDLEEDE